MRSQASILGHPLHPALVAVPIGLAIWAFVADLVFVFSDNMTWYDIALWTGIAFWISALVAAIPGFIDYFTLAVKTDARAYGTLHMLLNLTTVGLFIVATALAWDDGATSGAELVIVIVLHGAGVGLLAVSGWLGGEMVYRHHLAMIPDDGELEAAERSHHIATARRS